MKKFIFIVPLMAVSLLASCGPKPEPIIKHKLTFTGTNCDLYLDAEGKTKYTETDFDAGYTFSGYVIASEGYSLPTDVTFTSGGQTYKADTATYDSATGALSVKMNANIDVTAISEEQIDYTVTKEEFDKAVALTNVVYLQSEAGDKTPSEASQTIISHYSPNIYYYYEKSITTDQLVTTYKENYIYKINDTTFKKLARTDETTPWGNWEDASSYEWWTPAFEGITYMYLLADAGIIYDPSNYDPVTHSYIFPIAGGNNVIFKFENKKMVFLDFGVAANMIINFTYKEITPELPIPAPTI